MPLDHTPTRCCRADGRAAARQQRFLVSLAETGSVTTAAAVWTIAPV